MSFKRKLISAAATGFAVISFSALAASAQTEQQTNQQQDSAQKQGMRARREGYGGGEHRQHRGGEIGMRELAQLNLTDAQKQQIKGIMEANHKNGNQQDFQEMRTIMQAKKDGTITPEQEQQLKAFKKQMRQNMEQTHQQILAILTTEQRTQLEEIQKQRREQMQQRRQQREQNGKPAADKDGDDNN